MTPTVPKSFWQRYRGTLVLAGLAFLFGFVLRGRSRTAPVVEEPAAQAHDHAAYAVPQPGAAQEEEVIWTCAMHPQIRLPDPGNCPICGMKLIPIITEGAGDEDAPRRLVMSPAAVALADIQTAVVTRKFVETEVRMVGKIAYDETRLGYITARFPGRIDRLYVDYTGVSVREGDHLADLYSPELISAQEELFQALEAQVRLQESELEVMRRTAVATVDAARNKLRLWDLTPEQIGDIERRGTVAEHVTIYSPKAGIVIHRNATEGMYVKTGTKIYTIARLDLLWVLLEAYESDVQWLRYGQKVEFTTEAYPGRTFTGRIAFIDPVLDPRTRTIRVRVNVENPAGLLKPDMFVRATVRSAVAAGGLVIDPSLTGKWIGPMHPEIVRDEPGDCPICGMPLVRPEDIGLMPAMPEVEAPLVIPASAPLITGRRAIAYVKVPFADKPTFDGREITLGPRAGDHYIVLAGLSEGEEVVTNGNFKIDSALQILAKPSMMSPEGGVPQTGHAQHGGAPPAGEPAGDHAEHAPATVPASQPASAPSSQPGHAHDHDPARHAAHVQTLQPMLAPVFDQYFRVQTALAADDFDAAHAALTALHAAVKTPKPAPTTDADRELWQSHTTRILDAAQAGTKAASLQEVRATFLPLSEAVIGMEKMIGHAGTAPHYLAFCPMANEGQGAHWLQTEVDIHNPFYGTMMLSCGEIQETYAAQPAAPTSAPTSTPDRTPASQPTTPAQAPGAAS